MFDAMYVSRNPAHRRAGATGPAILAVLALGLCGLCTYQFGQLGGLTAQVERLSVTNALVLTERDAGLKDAANWKQNLAETSARQAEAEQKAQAKDGVQMSLQRRLTDVTGRLETATAELAVVTRSRDELKALYEKQRQTTLAANDVSKQAEAQTKEFEQAFQQQKASAEECVREYQKLGEEYKKLVARLASPGK